MYSISMRSFIAIKVNANEKIKQTLEKINQIEGVKTVQPENLHINLKFLGDINESQIGPIIKAIEKSKTNKFKIKLKEIGFFPNENFIRVIHIKAEAEELLEIHSKLEKELNKLGLGKEKHYIPHLTLARVKKKIQKPNFEVNFGEFEAKEIKLIKSELKKIGPIYTEIAKVKLWIQK